MGYFVPETMKQLNNWLLQKGKVPYSALTRLKTSPASPEGWASYEEVLMVLENSDFEGLGFGFLHDDGLTFIDIDHCIDGDGELSELAEEIMEMFSDTYAEVSQSETGLHIVCRGTIPQTIKRKDIEIYSSGRYMAFTGNAWTAAEPTNHQAELDMLYERYRPKQSREEVKKKPHRAHKNTTAEEVIAYILKSRQGAKFARLHDGQWGAYQSQSEAEMAYFAIVNFFTGGDDALTKEIFASSKLAERKKGKRKDYIQRTIDKAKGTATGSRTAKTISRHDITDQPEITPRRRF